MIICKLEQLLEQKDKSIYWLAKRIDTSHNNLSKLVKNETKAINFRILNSICKELECELSDVLEYVSDEK